MVKTTNQIAIPVSKENALNLCTGSTRQPTVWVGTTENLGHLMRLCWNLASYIKRFFGGVGRTHTGLYPCVCLEFGNV
jgi:hypothetical protein